MLQIFFCLPLGLLKYFFSSGHSLLRCQLSPLFIRCCNTAYTEKAQQYDDSCKTDSFSMFHLFYTHENKSSCNNYRLKWNRLYKNMPTPTGRNWEGEHDSYLNFLFQVVWQGCCEHYSHLAQNFYMNTWKTWKKKGMQIHKSNF